MNKPEFLPPFESMLKLQGKGIGSPGAKDMSDEYFARFKDLSEQQWTDLCETAKDSFDRFPTRKQLCEIASTRGFFDNVQRDPNRSPALTAVECSCGRSFVLREEDLKGFVSFSCPGKTYNACNKSFAPGFLRNCKRASNGVIWVKDQIQPEFKYPSFLS